MEGKLKKLSENIDLYFDKNYGKLYEKADCGTQEIFVYEDENGKITNQFLKREIKDKIEGKVYFDLITPYGYGGPIIENLLKDKDKLLQNYEKDFSNYCLQNNIVSEFVRFHPIIKNYEDFEKMYNAKYMRKTLATNLEKYEDPVLSEFSKSCRKEIRRVLASGVGYRVTEKPESLEEFKRIYYLNMERKNASEYYFFDDEYFNNIIKFYKDNLLFVEAIYENKTIAAGLYFVYNGIIHVHLSGTDTEFLNLSPAYILKYGTALWGKEHGYKLIHYGGGLSNSEEDSLYCFKRKFAKNTDFDFYIGKKIWNQEIYDKLCELKQIDKSEEFFPAYRKV